MHPDHTHPTPKTRRRKLSHAGTITQPPPQKREVRFPGLINLCLLLNRDPNHVRWVLSGKRKSAALVAAIRATGHPLASFLEGRVA